MRTRSYNRGDLQDISGASVEGLILGAICGALITAVCGRLGVSLTAFAAPGLTAFTGWLIGIAIGVDVGLGFLYANDHRGRRRPQKFGTVLGSLFVGSGAVVVSSSAGLGAGVMTVGAGAVLGGVVGWLAAASVVRRVGYDSFYDAGILTAVIGCGAAGAVVATVVASITAKQPAIAREVEAVQSALAMGLAALRVISDRRAVLWNLQADSRPAAWRPVLVALAVVASMLLGGVVGSASFIGQPADLDHRWALVAPAALAAMLAAVAITAVTNWSSGGVLLLLFMLPFFAGSAVMVTRWNWMSPLSRWPQWESGVSLIILTSVAGGVAGALAGVIREPVSGQWGPPTTGPLLGGLVVMEVTLNFSMLGEWVLALVLGASAAVLFGMYASRRLRARIAGYGAFDPNWSRLLMLLSLGSLVPIMSAIGYVISLVSRR